MEEVTYGEWGDAEDLILEKGERVTDRSYLNELVGSWQEGDWCYDWWRTHRWTSYVATEKYRTRQVRLKTIALIDKVTTIERIGAVLLTIDGIIDMTMGITMMATGVVASPETLGASLLVAAAGMGLTVKGATELGVGLYALLQTDGLVSAKTTLDFKDTSETLSRDVAGSERSEYHTKDVIWAYPCPAGCTHPGVDEVLGSDGVSNGKNGDGAWSGRTGRFVRGHRMKYNGNDGYTSGWEKGPEELDKKKPSGTSKSDPSLKRPIVPGHTGE